MKGFIKIFLMIYAMMVGFWVSFCVAYQLCGYELTSKAMIVMFVVAALVEGVYVASITKVNRK